MKLKIQAYIDSEDITESIALARANSMVLSLDGYNDSVSNQDIITKLYYITPILGRIIVVVTPQDRDNLGLTTTIIENTVINSYPLVMLPASIIEYKELVIKVGSNPSSSDVLDIAQSIVEATKKEVFPTKLPIVKIIDFNGNVNNTLVMPAIFGGNVFAIGSNDTSSIVINNSNYSNGDILIERNGAIVFNTLEDAYTNGTIEPKILVGEDVFYYDGTYYKDSNGVIQRYADIVNKDLNHHLEFPSYPNFYSDAVPANAAFTNSGTPYISNFVYQDKTYSAKCSAQAYTLDGDSRAYSVGGSPTSAWPVLIRLDAAAAMSLNFYDADHNYLHGGTVSIDAYVAGKWVDTYTIPTGYEEYDSTKAVRYLPL